ncbi:MAG TPA: signal peptidase I [Actinomycetes bacterium]|nr:signal peptidase I [Actinomycetes bacterium]
MTEQATTDAPQHAHRSPWAAMREGVVLVALALALAVLIRSFLVQAFFVPSESMEPTLDVNDRILVSKITTDVHGVKRGQVVVFKDPGGWLEPQPDTSPTWQRTLRNAMTFIGLLPADRGDDLVKRVIGVGGDHVVCCDAQGRITVNGKPLDEPYIAKGAAPSDTRFDVHVPPGHLWVMGDNRPFSEDSRPHEQQRPGGGMVPVGDVVGRVVLIVYPISRWATVPVPATFHDIPPGSS